jgi:hypothetical protein
MAEQPTRDPVIDLLASTQRETQDLVGALCQVHLERVRELFARDLHDQMMQVIADRFSQLELTLRPRMARARLEVARGITQVLNECFTRMRRFESDRSWCEAMLDAVGALSRRSAFFSVRGDDLCLQSGRSLDPETKFPPSEVPYAAAPAFHRVITSGKTHSIIRNSTELSIPIAAMFGSDSDARALLVPVTTGDRVPGVLYVEDPVDPSAVEVVAVMAGAVLEKHLRLFESVRSTGGPVRTVAVNPNDAAQPSVEGPEELEISAAAPPRARNPLQLEAERFARVEVARLLLAHTPAVSEGRRDRKLYRALHDDIDGVRAKYQARFHGVRDYLHGELVRTLALNDVSLLGTDYPGPIG